MLVVGRITKDAVVNTLQDERQVVNFSIAVNDFHRAKGAAEATKYTTYINCSYWISSKISERLKKGTLVELSGRLFVNAYLDTNNDPKASLNCHVNNIKIHSSSTKTAESETLSEVTANDDTKEDLPF